MNRLPRYLHVLVKFNLPLPDIGAKLLPFLGAKELEELFYGSGNGGG